jgi:hypothetical protein
MVFSHKNRIKELNNAQKFEISNFDKIIKGIASIISLNIEPSNRANFIVKSASMANSIVNTNISANNH